MLTAGLGSRFPKPEKLSPPSPIMRPGLPQVTRIDRGRKSKALINEFAIGSSPLLTSAPGSARVVTRQELVCFHYSQGSQLAG